jgi:hypothetical protein
MTFCILEKSGAMEHVLDEVDDVEEVVEEARVDRPPCLPWLMVMTG